LTIKLALPIQSTRTETRRRSKSNGTSSMFVRLMQRRERDPHNSAVVSDECELVFAGYAVFLDPPKASAGATIQALAAAAVRVLRRAISSRCATAKTLPAKDVGAKGVRRVLLRR
jgi:hypothetical protein